MKPKLEVLETEINTDERDGIEYICITDIARYKNKERTDDLIRNWLRNRNTIEFLGIWEQLNNPGFNPVEFDGFKKQAGLNTFTLTPRQWIERTGAMGVNEQYCCPSDAPLAFLGLYNKNYVSIELI